MKISSDRVSLSLSYTHLEINNIEITNMLASGYVIRYVVELLQNIEICNINLYMVTSYNNFLFFKSNTRYIAQNPTLRDEYLNEYIVLQLYANITNITINTCSINSNLIEITLFPYISMKNIFISGVTDKDSGNDALIIYFMFFIKSYFSLWFTDISSILTNCGSFIHISNSKDIIMSGISIDSCSCLYPDGTRGIYVNNSNSLLTKDVQFSGIDINSFDYGIFELTIVFKLNISASIEKSSNSRGPLVKISNCFYVNATDFMIIDSNLQGSSSFIITNFEEIYIDNVLFKDIKLDNGKSTGFDIIGFKDYNRYKLTIKNGLFINCEATALGMIILIDMKFLQTVTLQLENLTIVNSTSVSSGLIYFTERLKHNNSLIKNLTLEGNIVSNEIIKINSQGKLIIQNIFSSKNIAAIFLLVYPSSGDLKIEISNLNI